MDLIPRWFPSTMIPSRITVRCAVASSYSDGVDALSHQTAEEVEDFVSISGWIDMLQHTEGGPQAIGRLEFEDMEKRCMWSIILHDSMMMQRVNSWSWTRVKFSCVSAFQCSLPESSDATGSALPPCWKNPSTATRQHSKIKKPGILFTAAHLVFIMFYGWHCLIRIHSWLIPEYLLWIHGPCASQYYSFLHPTFQKQDIASKHSHHPNFETQTQQQATNHTPSRTSLQFPTDESTNELIIVAVSAGRWLKEPYDDEAGAPNPNFPTPFQLIGSDRRDCRQLYIWVLRRCDKYCTLSLKLHCHQCHGTAEGFHNRHAFGEMTPLHPLTSQKPSQVGIWSDGFHQKVVHVCTG